MRYGVGVDFNGYHEIYNDLLLGKDVRDFKFVFFAIMKTLAAGISE